MVENGWRQLNMWKCVKACENGWQLLKMGNTFKNGPKKGWKRFICYICSFCSICSICYICSILSICSTCSNCSICSICSIRFILSILSICSILSIALLGMSEWVSEGVNILFLEIYPFKRLHLKNYLLLFLLSISGFSVAFIFLAIFSWPSVDSAVTATKQAFY